jgi:hypothetical protein
MDKYLLAFNVLFDYMAGSLWKVREDLWQAKLGDKYDQNSTRQWHPGLSIKQGRITSYEAIPILFGTSSGDKFSSIIVKNVTEEEGAEKKTYFGKFIAPMQVADITGQNSPKTDKLVGYNLELKQIVINHHKPKLTGSEMNQLEQWINKKGL